MTVFPRYVEIGRVIRVFRGPHRGKMAVIIDVIDSNRVLVNSLDFPRSQVNIKNIILTGLTVKVPRNARKATLKKVLTKDNTVQKYSQLAAVKRIALLRKRAKMNDFDRFRVFLAKRQSSLNVRQEVNKLKKAAAKNPKKVKKAHVKKVVKAAVVAKVAKVIEKKEAPQKKVAK